MPRIHAFEFNDINACPAFIRDSVVEILGRGLQALDFGAIVSPAFLSFLARSKSKKVLDLASGTGVPARLICETLEKSAPAFVMSDLFPNIPSLELAVARQPDHLSFNPDPVDASAVSTNIDHDARTVFTAFHHFSPDAARDLIADAVAQDKALFLYEGFTRNLGRILTTMPAMGPCVWLNPWYTKKDRLAKVIFTYLIPLIPMVSMWDAIVSVLRVYSRDELMEMVADFDHYTWHYEEVPYGWGGLGVVFHGIPKSRA